MRLIYIFPSHPDHFTLLLNTGQIVKLTYFFSFVLLQHFNELHLQCKVTPHPPTVFAHILLLVQTPSMLSAITRLQVQV